MVFTIAPALVQSSGDSSLGLRWKLDHPFGGSFVGDELPRRSHAALRSTGTVALHPDRNPEDVRAAAEAGVFVALRRPPTHFPTDPDEAPTGGFNAGSLYVVGQLEIEGNQRLNESNGLLGAAIAYTQSRQLGLWPYLPAAVRLAYSAVVPLASEVRDATNIHGDVHGRFNAELGWHVPILRSPFTFHADLRYWTGQGIRENQASSSVYSGSGTFMSFAVGYDLLLPLSLHTLRLDEVFVRWSGGELPAAPVQTRAWLIGITFGAQ